MNMFSHIPFPLVVRVFKEIIKGLFMNKEPILIKIQYFIVTILLLPILLIASIYEFVLRPIKLLFNKFKGHQTAHKPTNVYYISSKNDNDKQGL